jgi:hypothetical protein
LKHKSPIGKEKTDTGIIFCIERDGISDGFTVDKNVQLHLGGRETVHKEEVLEVEVDNSEWS